MLLCLAAAAATSCRGGDSAAPYPEPAAARGSLPVPADVAPTQSRPATPQYQTGPFVVVGAVTFQVEVAYTREERVRGLSGREALASGSGMLLVFESPGGALWMKGMQFALDMVWIGPDCRVVGVTVGAPAPARGAQDSDLPVYTPDRPAAFALEVNAGEGAASGAAVGAPARFGGSAGDVDLSRLCP